MVVLTYIYCKEGSWKHENFKKIKIPNKIIWVVFFRHETKGRSGYRNPTAIFILGLSSVTSEGGQSLLGTSYM
jgi:hypothetical protein